MSEITLFSFVDHEDGEKLQIHGPFLNGSFLIDLAEVSVSMTLDDLVGLRDAVNVGLLRAAKAQARAAS